jgi:hypothetical protein
VLPSKDSATWRAVVTALQTLAAFLVAIVAQPETMDLINQYYAWLVPSITLGAGIASFLLNFVRRDVKNW